MKKSIIAILLSIMMISGSIGAVPVFASQPPAVQETANILTEEYGFSPEDGLSIGETPVLVDESDVMETGTNAAEDAAEDVAEEQTEEPVEEQSGQPAEEQSAELAEE